MSSCCSALSSSSAASANGSASIGTEAGGSGGGTGVSAGRLEFERSRAAGCVSPMSGRSLLAAAPAPSTSAAPVSLRARLGLGGRDHFLLRSLGHLGGRRRLGGKLGCEHVFKCKGLVHRLRAGREDLLRREELGRGNHRVVLGRALRNRLLRQRRQALRLCGGRVSQWGLRLARCQVGAHRLLRGS